MKEWKRLSAARTRVADFDEAEPELAELPDAALAR